MRSNLTAWIIAVLMCLAAAGALALRPETKRADLTPTWSLEHAIPRSFGEWREEPQLIAQVINPETQALLNKLYSQMVSRVYINPEGYRIMLSVAYGSDQRGSLQVHKPEVCYPAQGFTLLRSAASQIQTRFGDISGRRLFATMNTRNEPVTYWFTTGDKVVSNKLQKRLMDLRYALTGLIPDGMIFRVSSIDPDQTRANLMQDRFINQLLGSVTPADRKRLSGL
ncbi:MAG: EpsI family protein [Proteobacteria bacterium]|nr:EpsI family protein [Pseudomonadota bacterium]HQR02563.1 EpsI family protein [Rhodocyclaceae bacterium]